MTKMKLAKNQQSLVLIERGSKVASTLRLELKVHAIQLSGFKTAKAMVIFFATLLCM